MRLASLALSLTIGTLPAGAFGQSAREQGAAEPDRAERRRIEIRPPAGEHFPAPRLIRVGPRRNVQLALAAPATEKGAYLGVSTSPPPHVLRQQLKLPRGVGLVVDMVAPDSPAQAAGVKRYDVLHKLNDQILINQQQLAVLIRTYNPGDEVKLTVVRDGKPQELTAKLVEKELRPLEDLRLGPMGGDIEQMKRAIIRDLDDQARRLELEHRRLGRPLPGAPFRDGEFFQRRLPGAHLLDEGVTFTWDDGSLTLTVTRSGGSRHLVARDKTGKVLHDGPVDTEEQRKALPEGVRKKLESARILGPHGAPATRPATRPGVAPGAEAEGTPGDVLIGLEFKCFDLPDSD